MRVHCRIMLMPWPIGGLPAQQPNQLASWSAMAAALALLALPPPCLADDQIGNVVVALARAALVQETPLLPARQLDIACDAAGVTQALRLIDSRQVSDRAGTIALAARAQACRWPGSEDGRLIATHYQAVATDPIGLAVTGLVFGAISAGDYREVARGYLGKLVPGDAPVPVTSAALALDFAAGVCTASLTARCLHGALEDFLPPHWRLDAQSNLAFGDVFQVPVSEQAARNAPEIAAFLQRAGLPLRLDILQRLGPPRSGVLAAGRTQFYRHAYGSEEEI